MVDSFLIVGLGNPSKAYERTRHNIGFRVVDELAKRAGVNFRRKLFLKGLLAHGVLGESGCYLLKPGTYMNLSGDAVKRVMQKHAIALERLVIIADDVSLPFGQLRLKTHSGSGGHNGLKSIEACLQTTSYARLRIGVGDCREGDLAEYVLESFTSSEEKLVPEIVERAADAVQIWLTEGITSAMNRINRSIPTEGKKE